MHETAAERERRLRQIGGGSEIWNDSGYLISNKMHETTEERQLGIKQWFETNYVTNPCAEIMITSSQRCTLGVNPLIKYTKYKFNFNGKG